MKVLVGTDFHGNEAAFESFALKAEEDRAEIVIVCGDITHFGTLRQAEELLSLLTGLRVPVLFVPGNCDPPSLLGVDIEGVKCIHGQSVTYCDVTFLGLGGSTPTPFSTPFEMTEENIMETLNHASENLASSRWIVLVSHPPPRNTRLDKTHLGRHVGSLSVRKFVEERKPSVVFCGHIHEAKGKDRINNTVLVNPGPARHGDYAQAFFNEDVTIDFCTV
jgi:Icc-related predicted phosphoesterase